MSQWKCYRCNEPVTVEGCGCKDGQSIICGDCRTVLPSLGPFDLLLTDPPYGMSFQSNRRINKHDRIHGDDALPIDLIQLAISNAAVASYVFCRWDNLKDMPSPKSVVALVKDKWSMGDLKHEHGRQWEAACFYPGPEHRFLNRIPDVIFASRTGNHLHPTQKPDVLFIQLISCNDADTVCDPFLGSGTTLVAAKQLGRRGIGIEISEDYCRIAAARLRQGVLDFGETA